MVTACEDLVTKTEFNEFKSKINKLLGVKEDGGEVDVLENESLEGTLLEQSINLAFSAIQDFGIGTESTGIISADTANVHAGVIAGTLNYVKVQGSNVLKILPQATKSGKVTSLDAFRNKKLAKVGAAAGKVSGASIAVLSSLVNIIASLGLNIATVNTLGFRIDQTEKGMALLGQENSNLVNLLGKQFNDLQLANQELQNQQATIDQQGEDITSLKSDLATSEANNKILLDRVEANSKTIENLEQERLNLENQLNEFEEESTEEIEGLKTIITNLKTDLETAKKNSDTLLEVAQNLGEQLANLEGRTDVLEGQIQKLIQINADNANELNLLKEEFAQDKKLDEIKVKRLDSRIILLEHKLSNLDTNTNFLPSISPNGLASIQTKTLELANAFNPNPFPKSELQINPNNLGKNNPFNNLFDQLLPQINPQPGEITDVQFNELQTAISADIASQLGGLGMPDIRSRLTVIEGGLSPQTIRGHVEQGICNSTNPGGCLNNQVMNPLQNLQNTANNNSGLISGVGNSVNVILNQNILSNLSDVRNIVTANNNLLTNAQYGLQATKNFLTTAWETTRMGKILNFLSFILTLHNAAMLSKNLGASIGDAISAIANNSINFIKNEEGSNIDINKTLGNSIEGFMKATLGTENYNDLSETFKKNNRIISSASNIIWSIQSVQAGLAQGLQTVGNYTGRIGNALKRSGAVLESSYNWMNENLTVKTGRLGQVQAVLNEAQNVESIASEISSATAEFREAQEQVNGIGAQFKKIEDELTVKEEESLNLETIKKTNSQGVQPTQTDLTPDPKS